MSTSANVLGVRIWVLYTFLCGVAIVISVSRANSTKQASCTVNIKYGRMNLRLGLRVRRATNNTVK